MNSDSDSTLNRLNVQTLVPSNTSEVEVSANVQVSTSGFISSLDHLYSSSPSLARESSVSLYSPSHDSCPSSESSAVSTNTSGIENRKSEPTVTTKQVRKVSEIQGQTVKKSHLYRYVDSISEAEIDNVTEKLSLLFYGCNIPFIVANSDLFKNFINAIRPAYANHIPDGRCSNSP